MTTSSRMYRILLRAYPPSFRRQYGADMSEMFGVRAARARKRGMGALVRLWLSTIWDTLVAAPAERLESIGAVMGALFDLTGAIADVRDSVRRLLRTPAASTLTVLLLAVGIAGNVALFTVVNTLMIQAPAGIGDAGRAVEVMGAVRSMRSTSLSYPEFAGLRDNVGSLETVAAWNSLPMAVVREGAGRRLLGMFVSDGYFAAMGAQPVRGRGFTRVEAEGDGGAPLIVISHRFWRTQLEADAAAVGQTLLVNRVVHTIVGIGPAEFRGHMGPVGVDLWVPLSMHPNYSARRDLWSTSWLEGVGRLAADASIEEARVEANGVFERVRQGRPDVTEGKTVSVNRLGSVPADGRGIIGAFLALLMFFGVIALAVLCANVGGMVLARGMAREREIAVRLALGAGRARVVRQFLIESVILALVGGAAGIWLASAGLTFAAGAITPVLPIPVSLTLESGVPVLVFTIVVALGTLVVTGLVPAMRLVRDNVVLGLKGDGGGGGSVDTGRMRKLLVGGQMAASTLLLVVAALFVRSLQVAGDIDVGFEAEGVYLTTLNLEAEGYGDPDVALPVLQRLSDAVAAIPGVERVALASDLPMDMSRSTSGVRLEGSESDDDWFQVDKSEVGPGYFETLGIPIEVGRGFDDGDARGGDPVVVLSRDLADRLWPNETAMGRRLQYAGALHTVVGVVGGVLNENATDPMRPMVYAALAQQFEKSVELVVRTRGGEANLGGQIRSALLSVDPQLSEAPVRSLATVASLGLLPQRLAGGIAGAFGLLTVVLAAVGLYGTIAFDVSRRTREIGVRMALGAKRKGLVVGVLKDTVRLAAPGFVLGMVAAYGVGRLAYAFLLGIPSGDPIAFGGVAALLTTVVVVAAWVPALMASRVHPAEALRHE